MAIDSITISKIDFMLNNHCAALFLSEYLDEKEELKSVSKQIPFIVEFLRWHNINLVDSITKESVSKYLDILYSTKVSSYADVVRSYLRSFCYFLSSRGYTEEIPFWKRQSTVTKNSKPRIIFNYYKFLGIPKNSDLSKIKKAYHEKARLLHPDLNGDDPSSTDKAIALNSIYETLKDRVRRLVYDIAMGYIEYDEEKMPELTGMRQYDRSHYLVRI